MRCNYIKDGRLKKVYTKTRSNSVKLAPPPFTRARKRALCFFLSATKAFKLCHFCCA